MASDVTKLQGVTISQLFRPRDKPERESWCGSLGIRDEMTGGRCPVWPLPGHFRVLEAEPPYSQHLQVPTPACLQELRVCVGLPGPHVEHWARVRPYK